MCTFLVQKIKILFWIGHPFLNTISIQNRWGVSTDYKSSNRIKLSQLVQVIAFLLICQHMTVGGWMVGCVGVPPHAHMHACTCRLSMLKYLIRNY